ncbi:MAG: DsbA family protein [Deltaproteobacteria bacterium]|nr:DsbA family protein [Deltaproteobacteria bacterium]
MRITAIALLAIGLSAGAAVAEPLATVGNKTITRDQVETAAKSELAEIETQRYEVVKGKLDELVAFALFEQEATAKGVTVEKLTEVEIVEKVKKPTDAEIQKVYDDNKDQLQGAPLETVKPQIVEYLSRKGMGERQNAYIAELKKKYPTKIALKAPTVDVAIADAPVKGPANAPITIIEFSDYECPFCKKVEPTVQQVLKQYGDKIRFAYRNYPLPFHQSARPAAVAALCANEQGKFWPYHDKLVAASDLSAANLQQMASDVGIDRKKFDECVKSEKFAAVIDADLKAGQEAGVNGTPAFFINGRMLDGAQPFEKFQEIIEEELAAKS